VLTGILLSEFWSILGALRLSHTSLILAHDENRRTPSCSV